MSVIVRINVSLCGWSLLTKIISIHRVTLVPTIIVGFLFLMR